MNFHFVLPTSAIVLLIVWNILYTKQISQFYSQSKLKDK